MISNNKRMPPCPWQTIPAMLQSRFVNYADSEAIVDGDVRLTFDDLSQRVKKAAAALQACNFQRGDTLVLWAPNSWRWIVTALACWWLGGTLVPLSYRLKAAGLLPVLQSTGARLIFADSSTDCPGLVQQIRLDGSKFGHTHEQNGLRVEALVLMDEGAVTQGDSVLSWDRFLSAAIETCSIPVDVAAHDPWAIFFTSGSTGRPRAAVYSHKQSLRARWEGAIERSCKPGEKLLVTSPYSHIVGLSANLLLGLIAGMSHVVTRKHDTDSLLALIDRENINLMNGPPSLFNALLAGAHNNKNVLQTLRAAWIGGSDVPAEMVAKVLAAGADLVLTTYGLTESEVATYCRETDAAEAVARTVGKPCPGMSLKVVDEAGKEVADGDIGQILLQGYGLMAGYFNDPELTQETISADGWLKTGDLGRLTADGYLQIVGRLKEVIIVHGVNVYPADVEAQLLSSGLLDEVAVVGVPSKLAGEQCLAIAVAKAGIDEPRMAVMNWARRTLPVSQVPSKIVFMDELPLNSNGKVDKKLLKSRALGAN